MAGTILKVSVLADGAILLDGAPHTLEALASALDSAPKGDTTVWYHRENAGGEAPPRVREVMKLIVDRKLPLRLFAKPDFSDTAAPDLAGGLASIFTVVRQRAAQRQLVILRPDMRPMLLPALARDAAPADSVAAVERLLPSTAPRSVAVIADTAWSMAQSPNLRDAGSAIPFFGLLMGLAAIGHAVWVFDPKSTGILTAGCKEADLAIIDSARADSYPENWKSLITPVMRSTLVLVHDRSSFQLRKV